MDNFGSQNMGYSKSEVNEFVDYVIKKTEENIETIKNQREEIVRLNNEIENYKRLLETNSHFTNPTYLAEKEADLIIKQAKDNASFIVNDALVKAQKIENQRDALNRSIHIYKKKIRNTLVEQLNMIEEIEIL